MRGSLRVGDTRMGVPETGKPCEWETQTGEAQRVEDDSVGA